MPTWSWLVPAQNCKFLDFHPYRTRLENGLRLVYERRPGTGVVAIELYVDAGLVRESKPGLACLTGRLLEEGTATRSAQDLAETIEDVGGSLDVGATGGSLRVCSEDLPEALAVLADVVIRPAFPDDAVSWVARRIAAELRADREDPSFRADSAPAPSLFMVATRWPATRGAACASSSSLAARRCRGSPPSPLCA